jgi:hypothetical protein
VGLADSGMGPPPTTCAECRRERNRQSRADWRRAVKESGDRPYLKEVLCRDCGIPIPPAPPGARRPMRCDACRAVHKKPYLLDSAKNRAKHLRRFYGLTQPEFDRMAESQAGKCAICGTVPDRLNVDHDHYTNRIRGLLCGSCNRMIGLAKDDPARLAAAITYLAEHRTQT